MSKHQTHALEPAQRFSDKYFLAYLAILCWAPLPMGSNHPWSLSVLCALCLLLAAALVASLMSKQGDFSVLPKAYRLPVILLGLVPLWASLQSLALPPELLKTLSPAGSQLFELTGTNLASISLEPGRTARLALFSWSLWAFFISTLLLVDSQKRLRTLFWVIVCCGVFQALYGSFMSLSNLEYGFFTKKEVYLERATGTFVNRNHLAGFLEMCLAVGIGLLVANLRQSGQHDWRNRLRHTLDTLLGAKMRLRIFLAFMVIALVLTRSRMGNSAFFISLPLCGIIMMVMQRRLHKGAIILFASLMLVDFFIVGQWFGFDEMVERVQNTSAATETRDEVVRDSLLMVRDYAVSGTGLGTFYSSYPQYQGDDVIGFFDHAHNDYLEFATNLGLIGFIPLAMTVLLALRVALQTMYRRRDQLAKGAAFAAVMGIFSLLLHSSADFNLQIPANSLLFIVLLAVANIARQLPRTRTAEAH